MGYFDRFEKKPYKGKTTSGKIWHFIWKEDSVESWVVNIILAFVLIKFLVYPGLGLMLGTSHPIVAVVSGSMEHNNQNLDDYWKESGEWYELANISYDEFGQFPLKNGFNKGDIMVLLGSTGSDLNLGDVIVFQSRRPDPIIHRIVAISEGANGWVFQTKGDNNPGSMIDATLNEFDINENQVIGKAFIRVPYIGYVKIWAVEGVCLLGNFDFCIRR